MSEDASASEEAAAAGPQGGGHRLHSAESSQAVPTTLARFTDRARSSGVDFIYRNGEEAGLFTILESLGGGVGLIDFDRDDDLDLALPGGGEFLPGPRLQGLPTALYQNLAPWTFRRVGEPADVTAAPYYSHGAVVGDYDADGWPDLLLTGYGGVLLFRNMGDGTFLESAQEAQIEDPLWSSSGAWSDVNGDGLLDLYLVHYTNWSFDNNPQCAGPRPGEREICPPREFDPLPDALFLSNGDGTFRSAGEQVGLRDDGKGLGVVAADLDLDGDSDLYVANDTVPNFLYVNDGGELREAGLVSGTSVSEQGVPDGSMGVDVGDFNLDGRPDLWVANYERESFALYRNEGERFFQHVSQMTGVTALGGLYVGWGTSFLDFDRDADEDLIVSNGHVIRHPVNAPLNQRPLLLQNEGGARMVEVGNRAGEYFSEHHMGRGLAVGDLDNDGDLDVAVSHTNQPVALLSNESEDEHHWLSLLLIGRASNRDAVGATVIVSTPDGRRQLRLAKSGSSYASSQDRRLFFGLGGNESVTSVVIRWPSGKQQTISDLAIDAHHTILEPHTDPEENVHGAAA